MSIYLTYLVFSLLSLPGAATYVVIFTSSRHRQIIRDVLAVLGTILVLLLRLYILALLSLIPVFSFSGTVLLFSLLLYYVVGIGVAAISGRKGFGILLLVLIGCIIDLAVLFLISFIYYRWEMNASAFIDLFIYSLLLLLGTVTYVVIRKIGARRASA